MIFSVMFAMGLLFGQGALETIKADWDSERTEYKLPSDLHVFLSDKDKGEFEGSPTQSYCGSLLQNLLTRNLFKGCNVKVIFSGSRNVRVDISPDAPRLDNSDTDRAQQYQQNLNLISDYVDRRQLAQERADSQELVRFIQNTVFGGPNYMTVPKLSVLGNAANYDIQALKIRVLSLEELGVLASTTPEGAFVNVYKLESGPHNASRPIDYVRAWAVLKDLFVRHMDVPVDSETSSSKNPKYFQFTTKEKKYSLPDGTELKRTYSVKLLIVMPPSIVVHHTALRADGDKATPVDENPQVNHDIEVNLLTELYRAMGKQ